MNGTFSLASAHQQLVERIHRACAAAGRDPAGVTLLAVSKTRSPDEVAALAALGQRAMGENYLQEAMQKQEALADLGLQWHFIGPIQSNKTRKIAEHFDWVHSVEDLRIARRLSEQRPAGRGPLDVCLQVNVSGEASKSGCAPEQAQALALAIAALPGLRLRGLMAIPEPTDDAAVQRQRFGLLRELHDGIRTALAAGTVQGDVPPADKQAAGTPGPAGNADPAATDTSSPSPHPGPLPTDDETAAARAACFDTLSMGMSDDLEAAIAAGSTMVRIGTALFGPRPARPVSTP